ncbi:DNA-3-methyladenine glycosylase I [Lagierella massiliensis]|uniref:DNA-3-methyladenine glycosylase I n=1 Tax=Lagierella massiliensis TaxID=1689303 RepID=UPI0006D815EE|nr:DNA-3-methyladenine glycosylase I [Lagierella massiliensis]
MESKVCPWALKSKELRKYHDEEWGKISKDDNYLFEMLILESAQAGLNWDTILKKRDGYRRLYKGFNPLKVAEFDEIEYNRLVNDKAIIRNKRKILSSIENAKAFLKVQEEFGSFYNYIWKFTDGKQIVNDFERQEDMPSESKLSKQISKDMKSRGFSFVGPTIIYSYLQAIGVINDHIKGCVSK